MQGAARLATVSASEKKKKARSVFFFLAACQHFHGILQVKAKEGENC